MAVAPPRPIATPEAFQAAFGISHETIAKLETYAALLKRWQTTINLVSPSTLDDVWHRHFADSAQLWALGPQDGHWLDLGSGAGFPGLVLAIMGAEKNATHHMLIESDSRKAAFLREVARHTGVAVDILCTRIESAETLARVPRPRCVTARALAPMPRLAAWVAPYFASDACALFLKGRDVSAEMDAAARDWDLDYELRPSMTDPEGRIVMLKALKPKT